MVMGVDIETYSSVDLARAGARAYAEAEDFRILLIGYQIEEEPARIIDLTAREAGQLTFSAPSPLPEGDLEQFLQLLADPAVTKAAFNANFERTCLAAYFRRPMPPEQWSCTMVQAAALGLPMSLAAAGAALGLEQQKLEEGKALIPFFCQPGRDGRRRLPQQAPEKWELFRRYNLRDVEAETALRRRLDRWPRPQAELEAWQLDQRINDRGVRLDQQLMERALELDRLYTGRLMEQVRRITGLQNPRSDAQLKGWLADRGLAAESLDKNAIPALLEQAPEEAARRALEIRRELGKTSTKKFEAMRRGLCRDGRVRNLLQFYGAGTGRWAGRLVQVQNLPQNKLDDLETARNLVKEGEFDLLELAYGPPPFVLSQLIRTAFIPSEGSRFLIADYSAIEARVLAWLAGERWVLEEFRGEGLIYEAAAAMMFHAPKEQVRKGGPRAELRSKGKAATLACGYQGGPAALIAMGALQAGIPEQELPGIVQRWRRANPNIVRFWHGVERAAIDACRGKPSALARGLRFDREEEYLFITLPSGRRLAYYKPELRPEPQFDKMGLTYLGLGPNRRLCRQKTYGGKLAENITQAAARDCLRDAMAALEEAGYPVVFHVHDEIIVDLPQGQGSLAEMLEIMGRTPAWAPGLPLRAAGFESSFYRKD